MEKRIQAQMGGNRVKRIPRLQRKKDGNPLPFCSCGESGRVKQRKSGKARGKKKGVLQGGND